MVRRDWNRAFKTGVLYLTKHQPQYAIKHFKQALRFCPVYNKRDLNTILYYLGISLKKLGLPGSAVKSWGTGKKVYRHGLASLMYHRFINGYGMVKQATSELDDWNAYYSIQLQRYLNSKRSRKFGSEGEKDMIWDLIYDHWVRLLQSERLEGLGPCKKIELFRQETIVFPYFNVPDFQKKAEILVDFHKKSKIDPNAPCPCHSGLSYIQCCGRTKSEEELYYGVF